MNEILEIEKLTRELLSQVIDEIKEEFENSDSTDNIKCCYEDITSFCELSGLLLKLKGKHK